MQRRGSQHVVNANDKMKMAHLLSHQRTVTQADEDLPKSISYTGSAQKGKRFKEQLGSSEHSQDI